MNIRPGIWTPETESLIKSALATATIDDMKAQVKAGAKLFVLTDEDAELMGAFILRVDTLAGRNEGVIVAAGGAVNGVDITAEILPYVEKMFIGCETIRIHTERIGLAKKLFKEGYLVGELILIKELCNG